jgi:hypothetical protein
MDHRHAFRGPFSKAARHLMPGGLCPYSLLHYERAAGVSVIATAVALAVIGNPSGALVRIQSNNLVPDGGHRISRGMVPKLTWAATATVGWAV